MGMRFLISDVFHVRRRSKGTRPIGSLRLIIDDLNMISLIKFVKDMLNLLSDITIRNIVPWVYTLFLTEDMN